MTKKIGNEPPENNHPHEGSHHSNLDAKVEKVVDSKLVIQQSQ